ncbi:MAG TPA: YraN family protein [Ktedonobacterales bacterium]
MTEPDPDSPTPARGRAPSRRVAPSVTPRARLGAAGERLAALALERAGLRIVARNWHCLYGEIDLIAEDDQRGELVFVEVKTRRGDRLGTPEEAITPAKRRRVIAAAQTYLAEREYQQRPYRIDVAAVDLDPDGHLRGVRLHHRAITEE